MPERPTYWIKLLPKYSAIAFDEKQKKQREREYGPHVVDSSGNKRIQINRVSGSRNLKQDELLRGGLQGSERRRARAESKRQ